MYGPLSSFDFAIKLADSDHGVQCVCVVIVVVVVVCFILLLLLILLLLCLTLLLPVTMNIIIDLSNIMYNDLWM
jgi:hypothetical protein